MLNEDRIYKSMSTPNKAKSSIESGRTHKNFQTTLGLGKVPEKSKEGIAKANSPSGRGRPPGSVRV